MTHTHEKKNTLQSTYPYPSLPFTNPPHPITNRAIFEKGAALNPRGRHVYYIWHAWAMLGALLFPFFYKLNGCCVFHHPLGPIPPRHPHPPLTPKPNHHPNPPQRRRRATTTRPASTSGRRWSASRAPSPPSWPSRSWRVRSVLRFAFACCSLHGACEGSTAAHP